MSWIDKVSRIVCLNLAHREDRLIQFTEQAEKYNIPFERIPAIYNKTQGAQGLRDTMVQLFRECLDNNTEHLLVFEDDADFIAEPFVFHDTMNKVFNQLPHHYDMILLGCQLSHRIKQFHTENLFPVQKAFSTHSVMYSKQGMNAILANHMGFPIDNWLVDEIQPKGRTFSTYPMLCSQKEGYSDIGRSNMNWKPFLEGRYEQRINEYRLGMR